LVVPPCRCCLSPRWCWDFRSFFKRSASVVIQWRYADDTAGIPTIIKPFFGDQAFWSERVESLGVGSAVRKLTVENLTEALLKATTDEKQIAKAKVVGEMIRKVRPFHGL
jgi:hypothetical protein